MFFCRNRIQQMFFCPSTSMDSPDVPAHLFQHQAGFQNHYILCPANLHRLAQQGEVIFIGAVKLPHPAQVARGETGRIRVLRQQVFRRGYGGTLLGSATDDPADPAVQLHLRQLLRHEAVQRGIHGAVVDPFSDVHSGSPRIIRFADSFK